MLMLARNDSTSNLGNTISGVIHNAAPLMRKKKKDQLGLTDTEFTSS